jgi:Riboflavin kinase
MRYTISEGPRTPSRLPAGRTGSTPSTQGKFSVQKGPIIPKKFVQTKPCEIKRVSSDTFRIILEEGKNRQIRRMVEACGHQVKKLKRIRIEHILLGEMPDGAYRELKRGEREELLRRAAIPLVDFAPIMGEVIHGDGVGHTLGFPTANICMENGIMPDKTFTCRVTLDGAIYLGAGSYQVKK